MNIDQWGEARTLAIAVMAAILEAGDRAARVAPDKAPRYIGRAEELFDSVGADELERMRAAQGGAR